MFPQTSLFKVLELDTYETIGWKFVNKKWYLSLHLIKSLQQLFSKRYSYRYFKHSGVSYLLYVGFPVLRLESIYFEF